MPNISLTIAENEQSIVRPIVYDIIDQLQDITKITKESKIFYPGDTNRMQTPGSDIDSGNRSAVFGTNRINFIEIEEDYDTDYLGTTSVSSKNHINIFSDDKLGVYISPIYSTNKLSIRYKYRTPSKSEAMRWRDDFRMNLSRFRDMNIHTLTYHYNVPLEFFLVLKFIHQNREENPNLAYNQTLQEYVKSYFSDKLTLISDVVGQDTRLVMSETQGRVVGIFDINDVPDKPERDDVDGTWSVGFTYKLTYDKVIGCNMKYPIIIHNKLLPSNLVNFVDSVKDLDKEVAYASDYTSALSRFESGHTLDRIKNPDQILRIPHYDDFLITDTPSYTGTVFIALSEVEQDKRTLINLNELGDIVLDKDILQYIKEVEYPYLGKIYQSPFHISLYRDKFLARDDILICDSNLNIKSVEDLNLRRQHRVRFSLLDNVAMLREDFFIRVRNYPRVLLKYLKAVYEILSFHPDFIDLEGYERFSNVDWNNLMKLVNGLSYQETGLPSGSFYNTGNQGSNWPYKTSKNRLFESIPDTVYSDFKKHRVKQRQVEIFGVVATRIEDVNKL